MKLLQHILTLILVAALVAGCSDSSSDAPAAGTDGSYMLLQLSVPRASRANPGNGETGDGLENGTDAENAIENLCVFFYNHADGLNAPADTPFDHSVFFASGLTMGTDGSVSAKIPISWTPSPGDRMAVVANMGNITGTVFTLGDLSEYIVEQAWRTASVPALCTAFTMASANADDGIVEFDDASGPIPGTYDRPWRARAAIERTAARIDLAFNNAQVAADGSHLEYEVVSKKGKSVAVLRMENIIPVNFMAEGTWALKHVSRQATESDDCLSDMLICGTENLDANGLPSNYVVEPHSAAKAEASAAVKVGWFGESASANVAANFTSMLTPSTALATYLPYRTACTDGFDRTATLAYVNENTQHLTMHEGSVMTGLVLKGTYQPLEVYSDRYCLERVENFAAGTTFWRYSPTDREMDEGDVVYFTNHEAAENYRFDHPEEFGELQEFPNGVVYYNVWIRHANDDNSTLHRTCPMEFGIVRNNIYRLAFTFSGPGTTVPDIKDPHNVRFRIFVRKWNLRRQPPINM